MSLLVFVLQFFKRLHNAQQNSSKGIKFCLSLVLIEDYQNNMLNLVFLLRQQ